MQCYIDHIITRISIQTAGSAFGGRGLCSYRVRRVDGSCAKHSNVESYAVVMLLSVVLIIINSSPSPSLFHSKLKTFFFLQILPTAAFFLFFRTDYMDSADCLLLFLRPVGALGAYAPPQ